MSINQPGGVVLSGALGTYMRTFSEELAMKMFDTPLYSLDDAGVYMTISIADAFLCHYVNDFTRARVDVSRCLWGTEDFVLNTVKNYEPSAFHEFRQIVLERYETHFCRLCNRLRDNGYSEEGVMIASFSAVIGDAVLAHAESLGLDKPNVYLSKYTAVLEKTANFLKSYIADNLPSFAAETSKGRPASGKPALMTFSKFIRLALMGFGIAFILYLLGRK
jgi:hypothetical protein